MVRNFGERRKKRRGQSKKPKTKAPKTTSPSKSDQDVLQEPITCREMVVYVPKDTDAQQQLKSSGRVQAQCNCLVPRIPHKHEERHPREGGRFFTDDDDDDWEDVDDEEDDRNAIEEIVGQMLETMLLQMMAMSFSGRRVRVRQTPLFQGLFLPSFMRD